MTTDNANKQNTTAFPKNCQTHLEALKKSPTFAMSLGAKELFHTNFLAFLLESEDTELAAVRRALIRLLFDTEKDVGKVVCWREKNNLDLVVMRVPESADKPQSEETVKGHTCNDEYRAVIIEAKLKSIPTADQLGNYNEKLKGGIAFEFDDVDQIEIGKEENDKRQWMTTKIKIGEKPESWLITAHGKAASAKSKEKIADLSGNVRRILLLPDPEIKDDFTPWEKMGWKKIADICTNSPNSNSLLSKIVKDYGIAFDHLLEILAAVSKHVDTCCQTPASYDTYYSGIDDRGFKARRIHDLIGKSASHLLEEKIREKIEKALNDKAPHNFELNTYTHYSNQQPGTGFEWLAKGPNETKNRISFGIQIQGDEYRHFVCAEGGNQDTRKAVLTSLYQTLNAAKWFDNIETEPRPTPLCRPNQGKKKKEYYVFDESRFRYTKTKISKFTLAELATVAERSLADAGKAISSDLYQSIKLFLKIPAE